MKAAPPSPWRPDASTAEERYIEAVKAPPVRRPLRPSVIRTGVVVLLLTLWAAATYVLHVPDVALPPPGQVAQQFWIIATTGYQGHTLLQSTGMSLMRIGIGFGAAAVTGILLGFAMSANHVTFHLVDPIIQFLRPLPPLIYIPLLEVWFGIGELPKIVLIYACALPFVTIGTISGARSVKDTMIRMAASFGANRWQVFQLIVLPAALPEIITSLRLALGMAWTCLVAAEMIAASSGLGWMALTAGQQLQTDVVFVSVVSIAVLGYGLDLLFRQAEARLVPWKGKA